MKPLRLIPDDTKLPFMKWARIRTPISLALMALSLILFFTVGVNSGIDFKGGTVIEVRAASGPGRYGAASATKLNALGLGDVQVQGIGDESTVLIRIATQPGGEEAQQAVVEKVRAALGTDGLRLPPRRGGRARACRANWPGPGRSRCCSPSPGSWPTSGSASNGSSPSAAVATLVHDAVLTVGFFAVTQIDFNLSSIAAILTIIGYSLNDTVVIFDRIREILRKYKQMPISDVIDLATNQTLARTIMTSLTLLLALGSLFVFGGEVIRSFTAAMIWGIIVATASSIFIGGPILIYFNIRPQACAGD